MKKPKITFTGTGPASAAMPSKPVAPKKTGFAANGLMTSPKMLFVQRNASVLAFCGLGLLTVLFGASTVILWNATRAQPVTVAQSDVLFEEERTPTAETATRASVPDLTDVSAASAAVGVDDIAASALSQSILAGLQPKPETPAIDAIPTSQTETSQPVTARELIEPSDLQVLHDGMQAGAYAVSLVDIDGATRTKVEMLAAQSTHERVIQSLEQAALDGQLEVPAAMRTAQGGVDIETVVFDVIQNALNEDHVSGGQDAAREMSRRVFAASPVRTEFVAGRRIYTVTPDDSLAYIALQLFGSPAAHTRILAANSDTLQSPDQIKAGQRLIIPS